MDLSERRSFWTGKRVFLRVGNLLICSSVICSFAQIAQIEWANMCNLLRLLRTNEQLWVNRSGCSFALSFTKNKPLAQKNLTKIVFFGTFFVRDFVSFKKTSYERCEQIAQVPHQKWAMWANRSGRPPKLSDHERFAQVAHQKRGNEWIACFFLANRLFAHYSLNFL